MAFVSYKVKDDPFDWIYFFWCVSGIVAYGTFALGALKFLEMVPSVETESKDFQDLTYMGMVNSTVFAAPQFIYYVGCHALGFSFINMITLQRSSENQFISGHHGLKDIYRVIPISMLFFFISGNVVLRNEYHLQSYCNANQTSSEPMLLPMSDFLTPDLFSFGMPQNEHEEHHMMVFKALKSIEDADYFGRLTVDQPCHIYSHNETFSYNSWTWTLGLFVGLQWTHVEPMMGDLVKHFVLVWSVMILWPWYTWLIFLLIVAFISLTGSYALFLYSTIGMYDVYVQTFLAVIAIFAAISAYYKGKKELHFHHYVLGYFVMAFICWQNVFLSLISAFFTGLMLEGSCVYGQDPIWTPIGQRKQSVVEFVAEKEAEIERRQRFEQRLLASQA